MRYIPAPPLDTVDKETSEYLQREHERISGAILFPVVHHILVEQIQAEPAKPRDGMVAYADGTNWNPGCGNGFYRYKSSTSEWRYLELKGTTAGEAFGIISVSGQDDVVADVASDTWTLVADTKITLTNNAALDETTIQAKGFLDPDVTDEVTVGYTTTTEADNFASNLVPDLTKQHLKTLTVSGNITIDEPTGVGHCEYYVTVQSPGGYSVTAGTGVKSVGTLPSLALGTDYVMNIRRYGTAQTIVQLLALT